MSNEITQQSGNTALTIHPDQTTFTPDQQAALQQLGVQANSAADVAVFFHQAKRSGLDPFKREIYMITRKGKPTIQTGIDGFRVIANRSPAYQGQTEAQWCGPDGVWKDVWLSTRPPSAARVGIHRRGFIAPVYGVALFTEYAGYKSERNGGGLTRMWETKPAVMLAKCAEALALRKAFPQDLAGLYTSDEMSQADSDYEPPPRVSHSTSETVNAAPVVEDHPLSEDDKLRALWMEHLHQAVNDMDFDKLRVLGTSALEKSWSDYVPIAQAAWQQAAAAHRAAETNRAGGVIDAEPESEVVAAVIVEDPPEQVNEDDELALIEAAIEAEGGLNRDQ